MADRGWLSGPWAPARRPLRRRRLRRGGHQPHAAGTSSLTRAADPARPQGSWPAGRGPHTSSRGASAEYPGTYTSGTYPGYASPAYPNTLAASPYTILKQPNNARGGRRRGDPLAPACTPRSPCHPARRSRSDELYIPFSPSIPYSFSPFRGFTLPPNMSCFKCGVLQQRIWGSPSKFINHPRC